MVQCELCGRQFKNTQGLRGHKTFVHDIRADHSKMSALLDRFGFSDPEADNPGLTETEGKLGNIIDRVTKVEHAIEELKETLEKWETYVALLATQNEVHHLVLSVKLIKEQVEKHDRWLNPRGLHEAVIGLAGGPIADLEKRLKGRQSSNN